MLLFGAAFLAADVAVARRFCIEMTKSLRKLRKDAQKRNSRDDVRAENRRNAVVSLRKDPSRTARSLAASFHLSLHAAQSLKRAVMPRDDGLLSKLLNPRENRAGRRCVLTKEEESILKAGFNHFNSNVSAADEDSARSMMGKIASDGRGDCCKNELPCKGAFIHFRARNPDLTNRRQNAKDQAKTKAETWSHVSSLKDALEEVLEKHPSPRSNPEAIVNIDEVGVNTEFGERKKTLVSTSSRAGAGAAPPPACEKHATLVISASAAGRIAPPFFAVAGKNAMSSWAWPLDAAASSLPTELQQCGREDWIDSEAAVFASPNGSMGISLIRLAIDHIGRFFRRFAPPAEPPLLLLDGHSGRNGPFWLLKATKHFIEIAKPPASASRFLQPCDNAINKQFKRNLRRARGSMLRRSFALSTGSPQFKLICASHAMRSISPSDCRKSFEATGIWPMGMRFLLPFQTPYRKVVEAAEEENARLSERPKTRNLAREKDSETVAKTRAVLQGSNIGPAKAIQKITATLKNAVAANSLILGPSAILSPPHLGE